MLRSAAAAKAIDAESEKDDAPSQLDKNLLPPPRQPGETSPSPTDAQTPKNADGIA
jgi:hypothetical protein